MIIAGIGRGSALPLFKDIFRISDNMKQAENIRVYLWVIAILLENDPVLMRQMDQTICMAHFCVSVHDFSHHWICLTSRQRRMDDAEWAEGRCLVSHLGHFGPEYAASAVQGPVRIQDQMFRSMDAAAIALSLPRNLSRVIRIYCRIGLMPMNLP
jgi:hypothetical protein